MSSCLKCGSPLSRRPRNPISKVYSRATLLCKTCGTNQNIYRSLFAIFQPGCRCPRCDNRDLTVLKKRDRIDRMTLNPLRRALGLFGFPLYHCTFCRLQFRDWRKLHDSED